MAKPRPMTLDALASAFGGESMAHMRYLVFAEIAEREGYPNVARLFKAIAFAEKVHASNHYSRLRDLETDLKVVAGATFLPLSDCIARTVPGLLFQTGMEIPVGVITSLFGAPFFIYLLIRGKRNYWF